MLSVRTYLSLVEASLARGFLTDHGIFCRLGNENAHMYGGSLAMPIQLLVRVEDVTDARRLLSELEKTRHSSDVREQLDIPLRAVAASRTQFPRNNPWEILVIAAMTLIPALCLLLTHGSAVMVRRYYRRSPAIVVPATALHVFGFVAAAFAAFLVFLYFRARVEIEREERAAAAGEGSVVGA
jgi:hypothetical protein